jgi:hypothetical protein
VAVNSSPQSRNFDPEPGPATTATPPTEAAGSPDGAPSPGVLGSAPDRRYLLDNAQAEAGERFVALAELFDGVTRGHFDRLGMGPGWRCWEVGAGGRSVPEALAAAVGPTGYVLATDINPAWLDPHGTYEVRRHDIVADPPPATFDLDDATWARGRGWALWKTLATCASTLEDPADQEDFANAQRVLGEICSEYAASIVTRPRP